MKPTKILLSVILITFSTSKTYAQNGAVDSIFQTSKNFIISANKAYFYVRPDLATKEKSYLIRGNQISILSYSKNNFVYSEYKNSGGGITKGWVSISDLKLPEISKTDQSGHFNKSSSLNTSTPFDFIYHLAMSDSLYEDYFNQQITKIGSWKFLYQKEGDQYYINIKDSHEIIRYLSSFRALEYWFTNQPQAWCSTGSSPKPIA